MKKLGFWIYDLYNFFFDLKINPLRHIPNAFTPNNTGPSVNNTFKPITGSYLKAQFSIYNRWGEKLFETNNLTNGWDGKSNGLHGCAQPRQ